MRNDLECIWPTKELQRDRRHLKRKVIAPDSAIADEDANDRKAIALIGSSSPEVKINHVQVTLGLGFPTELPVSQTKIEWPSWIVLHVEDCDLSIDVTGGYTVRELGQLLTAPIRTEETCSLDLLASFVNEFLPSRIHPGSHTRFFDFSYLYEMALAHSALLNACLACAASAVGASFQVPESQSGADQRYSRSISLLRKKIQGGECDGDEDWLLATVVILSLYENRQPRYNPAAAATHIAAASQVFRQRARTKMSAVGDRRLMGGQIWPTLVFERMFIEAFLYHCMVMSVQETNLTPLQDALLRPIFDIYFEMCVVPTSPEAENWPVFGMHYQIIRLLSDLFAAVDLSKTASSTEPNRNLHEVITQLGTWELDTLTNDHGIHILLYISSAKLLGYHYLSMTRHIDDDHPAVSQGQLDQLVQKELKNCLNYVSTLQVTDATFTRYFHWPLAIIDKVVRDTRASDFVEQQLQDASLIDPAGKKPYEWLAKGFEKRFRTNMNSEDRNMVLTLSRGTYT